MRHATHHFQWQKNTICICGLRGFKKHYREKTFEKIHVHCNLRIHIFVKSIDMFFGTTVQTGYAFWAGLAEVFCSRCPPWTLVGWFHLPTLRHHTCHPTPHPPPLLPIFGHMISVPLLYHMTNNRFTTETTS